MSYTNFVNLNGTEELEEHDASHASAPPPDEGIDIPPIFSRHCDRQCMDPLAGIGSQFDSESSYIEAAELERLQFNPARSIEGATLRHTSQDTHDEQLQAKLAVEPTASIPRVTEPAEDSDSSSSRDQNDCKTKPIADVQDSPSPNNLRFKDLRISPSEPQSMSDESFGHIDLQKALRRLQCRIQELISEGRALRQRQSGPRADPVNTSHGDTPLQDAADETGKTTDGKPGMNDASRNRKKARTSTTTSTASTVSNSDEFEDGDDDNVPRRKQPEKRKEPYDRSDKDQGRLPCTFHIGEPKRYCSHVKKWKYVSELVRHLNSAHKLHVCCKCLRNFTSRKALEKHPEIECEQDGCLRYHDPFAFTMDTCDHVKSPEQQWEALFRLIYSDRPALNMFGQLITAVASAGIDNANGSMCNLNSHDNGNYLPANDQSMHPSHDTEDHYIPEDNEIHQAPNVPITQLQCCPCSAPEPSPQQADPQPTLHNLFIRQQELLLSLTEQVDTLERTIGELRASSSAREQQLEHQLETLAERNRAISGWAQNLFETIEHNCPEKAQFLKAVHKDVLRGNGVD